MFGFGSVLAMPLPETPGKDVDSLGRRRNAATFNDDTIHRVGFEFFSK